MQRRKRGDRLDLRQSSIVDQHGPGQIRSTMDDPMAEGRDRAGHGAVRQFGDRHHRRMEIGCGDRARLLAGDGQSGGGADALDLAGDHWRGFRSRRVRGEFQAGRARV